MKILLRNLTKRFPDRNKKTRGEITAVNDLTLEIPDGKLVGLLGPSGCGKTHWKIRSCNHNPLVVH